MNEKLKPFKLNPPNFSQNDKLQEFLEEGNIPEKSGSLFIRKTQIKEFPWDKPNVREDLKKTFNLRLSEKDFIKLEYLSQINKESMHKICIDILIPKINDMLKIK